MEEEVGIYRAAVRVMERIVIRMGCGLEWGVRGEAVGACTGGTDIW